MAVKREALDKVGLFDDDFVAHWEDVDLSWRIRLAGYRIALVPEAVVYHKVSRTIKKFGRSREISFHIRKNRIVGLIKNYSLMNLTKTLPLLVMFYFGIFIKELAVNRDSRNALTSLAALGWNLKSLLRTLRQRNHVQKTIRKVPDRVITVLMPKKLVLFSFFVR